MFIEKLSTNSLEHVRKLIVSINASDLADPAFFQLLGHQNKILEEFEMSINVDVIYLDFAEAFN